MREVKRTEILSPGVARLYLCGTCAANLRIIRDAHGSAAMAAAIGDILCDPCKRRVPGYQPGQRLVVKLKAVRRADA